MIVSSEFMGKMFQAAQHMTIDHSCQSELSRTGSRGRGKFSLADIKKILHVWPMVKNLSCVSCAAWNVFPINSLLLGLIQFTMLPWNLLNLNWQKTLKWFHNKFLLSETSDEHFFEKGGRLFKILLPSYNIWTFLTVKSWVLLRLV